MDNSFNISNALQSIILASSSYSMYLGITIALSVAVAIALIVVIVLAVGNSKLKKAKVGYASLNAESALTGTEKTFRVIRRILIYLLMTFFAVIMLLPFYWSIITAIRPQAESMAIPISFIPKEITFDNFTNFFTKQTNFFSALGYTVLITVVGMFTNLFFGSMAGYAFSKLEFRGRKTIFKIMIASLMVPSIVTLLPQYFVLAKFPLIGGNDITGTGGAGFIGTPWAVVLPGAIGVYGIFFMRQFFHGTPKALGEAARIDGASEFRIFWQIYLPQVTSGLITLGIITFNSYWNSYLWPSVVLSVGDVSMLSLILGRYQQIYDTDYGAIMAGSIIIMLPSLLIFAFLQKYFLNTVTFAGIKE